MARKKIRAKGEGSITELAGGRFQARLSVGGKRKAVYGKTYEEAARNLQALRERLKKEEDNLAPPESFRGHLERFLGHVLRTNAYSTWDVYNRLATNQVLPTFGSVNVGEITRSGVEDWVLKMAKGDLAPSTQKMALVFLKSLLADAVSRGLLRTNPADKVRLGRHAKAAMRCLDAEQVTRLCESVRDHRLGPLVVLLLDTGMRLSEALALHGEAIDLNAGTVSINWTLAKGKEGVERRQTKTKHSRRTVRLSAPCVRHLQGLSVRRGHLVFHADGEPDKPLHRNGFGHVFNTMLRRAGLPRIRLHDLRHTNATLMLGGGVHPKIVSQRLGHSTVSITLDIYSHVMPGYDQAAVDVMTRILV